MKSALAKWEIIKKRLWTSCKKRRIISNIICLETSNRLKRRINLCKKDLRLRKGNLLNWKIVTTISKQLLQIKMRNCLKSLDERGKSSMKDWNNSHQRFQREIEQYFLSKIRRKVSLVKLIIKTKVSMNLGRRHKTKNQLIFRRLKTSNKNMTLLWTNLLKVKSTSKERKLSKTKRSLSKSRELMSTTIKWNKL